jgi:hypothetical protein
MQKYLYFRVGGATATEDSAPTSDIGATGLTVIIHGVPQD